MVAALAACGMSASCSDSMRQVADAGLAADASNLDAAVGVECRTTFCNNDQFCCLDNENPPRILLYCLDDSASDVACFGAEFDCNGPEDCADGEFCCSTEGSECTIECQGTIACHTVDDCPAVFSICATTPLMLLKVCR